MIQRVVLIAMFSRTLGFNALIMASIAPMWVLPASKLVLYVQPLELVLQGLASLDPRRMILPLRDRSPRSRSFIPRSSQLFLNNANLEVVRIIWHTANALADH